MLKGIDVSKHQGAIDWKKVKEAGIQFAILRAGWTHYQGGLSPDSRFAEYIKGAQEAGIPVGVYVYGYDLTPQAAKIAAEKVVELIRPYKLEYPVWYDQEYEPEILALSKAQRTEICRVFLDTVQQAGYYTGLYASKDWLENMVDGDVLAPYDKWVASYRFELPWPSYEKSGYSGSHGIWQYTVIGVQGTKGKDYWTTGNVSGISTNCDLNISYLDYPQIIQKAGLNHLKETGTAPAEPPPSPENVPDTEINLLKEKAQRFDRLYAGLQALVDQYENKGV